MDGKLFCEIVQRIESVARIETLLILAMAALHLAVMPRGIGTNAFMSNAQLRSGLFKQCGKITLAVGKTIGKLKAVVRLNTLYLDASTRIPGGQSAQEVCRRIGGLLWVGSEKAQACELVDGGVLEQAKLRNCDAAAWNDLHIHLNALSRVSHLRIRLWLVLLFRLFGWKQPYLAHDAIQALRAAGIAALLQAVPKLDQAQLWISVAHITDELQFGFRVLIRMTVRSSGLAGEGRCTAIPALLPEVDVRPAFVVLPAGTAHAVLLCVLH